MFENGRTDLYHKFLVLSSAHVWAIYQISNIYFESFLGYGDQNKLFCYSFPPHFLWDHFNIQVTHLPNFKYLTAWRFRLADPNQTAKFENSRFYRSDLVDMKLYWLMKELQASKDSCVHFVFMLTWTPNLKSLSSYQEFTNEYMFLIILRLKIHIILLTKILLRIQETSKKNMVCYESYNYWPAVWFSFWSSRFSDFLWLFSKMNQPITLHFFYRAPPQFDIASKIILIY